MLNLLLIIDGKLEIGDAFVVLMLTRHIFCIPRVDINGWGDLISLTLNHLTF